MKNFNIYLCGVGGQGIGLISEIMLRAADRAGMNAIGVDTHGLAQRGGIVASQIRIGDQVHSPLVAPKTADLVISLERTEAIRGAAEYLKADGTLIYFDARWQPLPVRLGKTREITIDDVKNFCGQNSFKMIRISSEDLPDPRMQNIALLAGICRNNLVDGVEARHYEEAMNDLMSGSMLENNLKLFRAALSA
ncbi:MAG: 2-oxoacid:acceptor oxidoreductase family protein [Candidatus Rifleibacteriota bacterium]